MSTSTFLTKSSKAAPVPSLSAAQSPTFVISPAGKWEGLNLSELWQFRHLIQNMVSRNVKRRYRQTLLGPIWFILTPLMRMVLFSLLLGYVARLPSDGVPYPIFIYSALLPWELFVAGMTRSTTSLVTYMHIISKLYFPRLILPISETLTALADFAISFLLLLVMVFAYRFPLTPRLLVLPLLILLAMALGCGVGLFFAALHVRYRDVGNFVSYLVQIWFYGTPVAYSANLLTNRVPEPFLWLYRLNPMNGVVEGFRWALLGTGVAPDWKLAATGLGVCLFLYFSAIFFHRAEHSIVDLV
jgi:lipopolysaccharide transport system permease protein